MAGHVFISYSREDRPYVEALAAELSRLDIPVWYDRHIKPGAEFIPEIDRHILTSSAVVVVLSPAAVDSKWVQRELSYAIDTDKRILPLQLEVCRETLLTAGLQREDVTGSQAPGMEFLTLLAELTSAPAPRVSPRPAAVQWSWPTGHSVADVRLRAALKGLAEQVGRETDSLPDPVAAVGWDGGPGDTTDLSGLIRDPTQRVAVVGPSGSGKTTVLTLLRAEMARAAAARSFPPPVLVDIRSWRPDQQAFEEWLAAELRRRYPRTRGELDPGNAIAEFLVDHGWVFPLVDRFDELPEEVRATALRKMEASPLAFVVASTALGTDPGDDIRMLRLRPLDRAQIVARLPDRSVPEHVAGPLRSPRNFDLLSRMSPTEVGKLLELPDEAAVETALLAVACDVHRDRPYWPAVTHVAERLAKDHTDRFRWESMARETTTSQLWRWFALPAGAVTFLAVLFLAVWDWQLPAFAFAGGAGAVAALVVGIGGALMLRWPGSRHLAVAIAVVGGALLGGAAILPIAFSAASPTYADQAARHAQNGLDPHYEYEVPTLSAGGRTEVLVTFMALGAVIAAVVTAATWIARAGRPAGSVAAARFTIAGLVGGALMGWGFSYPWYQDTGFAVFQGVAVGLFFAFMVGLLPSRWFRQVPAGRACSQGQGGLTELFEMAVDRRLLRPTDDGYEFTDSRLPQAIVRGKPLGTDS